MYCADCESIDDYFFETTHFWIFVPTLETFSKVAGLCGSMEINATQQSHHCISCVVARPNIQRFIMSLNGALESKEKENTKVTTASHDQQPSIHDMGRMVTLEVLVNRYQAKWLVESIEKQRYESWFQPIISAVDGQVFANEGLFRVRDDNGSIVPPALAFKLAEKSDLLFSLDLVARRSAVECAARGKLRTKLFINFNPSSIYDPSYCLRATAAAISDIGLSPSDIVFEVTETHRASDINHLKGILAFYRNAGFQIALDDIGSGWSGLNLLQSLRPDFVKIDMELVRNVHSDSYKQNIVKSLIQIANRNGIEVIAEGVETEDEAQWLKDARADYLQGYLYGKPAPLETSLTEQEASDIEDKMKPLKDAAAD